MYNCIGATRERAERYRKCNPVEMPSGMDEMFSAATVSSVAYLGS